MALLPAGDGDFSRSLYERIGPEPLAALVERFYQRVAADPLLAPIFPVDLSETAQKQFAFLSGFTGGPPLYHQRYGHPRLRARHLPFPITPARARAWLACLGAALEESPEIAPADGAELYAALSRVAAQMVNTPEGPGGETQTTSPN